MSRIACSLTSLRTALARLPGPGWRAVASHGCQFTLARWLFLRLVGIMFLIAFASIWVQVDGLIGSHGILPIGVYLDRVRGAVGEPACYWQLPTLCWFTTNDWFLHAQCAAGVGLALLLVIDLAPGLMLILLWLCYLSLTVAGQMFLSFQWDVLLLETAFFGLFITSWNWRPTLFRARAPSSAGILLMHFLVFKLMFLSGITKLLSGDEAWRGLTAMNYHYFTQPIPAWTSWYMQQLPQWVQKLSVGNMFLIEIVLPFGIFGPRLVRHLAAVGMIGLQVMIGITGNYGFFNISSIALCMLLLDNRLLTRLWLLRQFGESLARQQRTGGPTWRRAAVLPIMALLFALSLGAMAREMTRTAYGPHRGWAAAIFKPLEWIAPFRTINGYGLFRVMTTQRPEFIIRGSEDGLSWREYEFRYKPGDVNRAPSFVAPHMPRLDWQMWFAALNPGGYGGMLQALINRLFENEPAVLKLLAHNPFPDKPPRHIQLIYFEYTFTDWSTGQQTGRWWNRSQLGQSQVYARRIR